MSFFPFFSTIQHHASWFKNISIEEFANRTAYDCMNNPYSDKYDDLMSYISCANEISSDSTGALVHTHGNIPGFVFPCGSVTMAGVSSLQSGM
jgi:hypothetical protein